MCVSASRLVAGVTNISILLPGGNSCQLRASRLIGLSLSASCDEGLVRWVVVPLCAFFVRPAVANMRCSAKLLSVHPPRSMMTSCTTYNIFFGCAARVMRHPISHAHFSLRFASVTVPGLPQVVGIKRQGGIYKR